MEGFVTRLEYEEHNKRMDDEHKRQNTRIGLLEKTVEQNNKLLVSVEKLALSMEGMKKELQEQGERLATQGEEIKELKGKDGEMWRNVIKESVKVIVGILIGFVFTKLGM